MSKKVMLLLPDGVGLRNFIYTDFLDYGEVVVWTPIKDLKLEGVKQLALPKFTPHWLSDIYKSSLVDAAIYNFSKVFNAQTYLSYIRPRNTKTFRAKLKSKLIDFVVNRTKSFDDLLSLRQKYEVTLRKSQYYLECQAQLEAEKPAFVFCTNQRVLNAAPAMLAAQDMGIPTGTFIFSWDNLPKGNLSVTADYYFVWSEYMKDELIKYYPFIESSQVIVTGTPQFLPYFDEEVILPRETFCQAHNLPMDNHIICYSGDDITTSPNDPSYLKDTAKSVRALNEENDKKITILFRRCPVDKSDRFDEVLAEFQDVIMSVDPLWGSLNGLKSWDAIMPLKADNALLANTVYHCETVINLGSTMALDFAILNKTACYINYNVPSNHEWKVEKIYKYIHFQSMGDLDPVYWINDRDEFKDVIVKAIHDSENKLPSAQKWAKKIALHPLEDANKRVWDNIMDIVGTTR